MATPPPIPLGYDTASQAASVWVTRAAVGFACYPLLLLSALYGTWLAAGVTLGYAPRPSLDDPKRIGFAVDVLYWVTLVLLIIAPMACSFSMASLAADLFARASVIRRVTWAYIAALLAVVCTWVGAFLLLRWDPWSVGVWFMD